MSSLLEIKSSLYRFFILFKMDKVTVLMHVIKMLIQYFFKNGVHLLI